MVEKLGQQTLEKKLGRRLSRLRKTLGQSRTEFATAIGIRPQYLTAIEEGKVCMTAELATRVVLWAWEGYSWKDAPSLPATLLRDATKWRKNSKPYKTKKIIWPDAEVYRKQFDAAQEAADALGVSFEAFVLLAVARLIEDYPTLITLREGARAYEQMRIDTVRQWFPEVIPLLDGDATAAKALHDALGRRARIRRVSGKDLDALSIFEQWSIGHDGPSTPLASVPAAWRPSKHAIAAKARRETDED